MIYTIMVVSVLVLVGILVLFILGYRLDSRNNLEQGALMQFDTQPGGATVMVDGAQIGGRTPNKTTVFAGPHAVTISKPGYQPWGKTVEVKAGTLTWLDYGLLVPVDLATRKVALYPSIASMLTAEDDETILLQPIASRASFEMIDLRQETPTITTVSIPANVYSEPNGSVTHTFRLDQYDTSGRYALVQHTYGDATEWIVLDTQNPLQSRNITTILNASFTKLAFSGTSGSTLYGLNDGSVRKIDLSNGTMSRALITNATDFSLFETNMLSYVGTTASDSNRRIAGVYQDGDDQPVVLRSTSEDRPLHIAVTHYFNDDYIAVSLGSSLQIWKGFPHSDADVKKLELTTSIIMPSGQINALGFSPKGEYALAQSGDTFVSYDLERQTSAQGTITNAKPEGLKWLNEATLYSMIDGSLVLREFDGTNVHAINGAQDGLLATLSPNGRFLYSIQKVDDKYQLQRVTMLVQ